MSPDRSQLVDWALAFLAVGTIAGQLGVQAAGSPEARPATLGDVRDLEQAAKLLDADLALSPELREAIGLSGDPEKDRERVEKDLRGRLEHAAGRPRLLVVAAAVAAGFGEDAVALEALDLLAADEDGLATWRVVVDGLHDLARGRPARDLEVLAGELTSVGASPWLDRRVRARDAENRGDGRTAEALRAEARGFASAFVERFTLFSVVGLALFLAGALLLLLWPLVRRALAGAGISGLTGLPSPFVAASTTRIVSAWFLVYVGIGSALVAGAAALGGDAGTLAFSASAQSLVGGGVAIALLRRWGRRGEDAAPLAVPLRLGIGEKTGGVVGLLAATVGGVAIALVAVAFAVIVLGALHEGGAPAQPLVELFAEESGAEPRVLIALAAVLVAPFFEEVLFRGFLYRNLRDLMDPTLAMLLTGLVFALCHMELYNLLPLWALGTVLAFVFEKSGTLLAPILVHSLWNAGSLVLVLVVAKG